MSGGGKPAGKSGGKPFGKPGAKPYGKPGAKPVGKFGNQAGGPPRPWHDRDEDAPQFEAGGDRSERRPGPQRDDRRGSREAEGEAPREGGAPQRGRPFAGLGGPRPPPTG